MKERIVDNYYRTSHFIYSRLYEPLYDLYWRIKRRNEPKDIGCPLYQLCG